MKALGSWMIIRKFISIPTISELNWQLKRIFKNKSIQWKYFHYFTVIYNCIFRCFEYTIKKIEHLFLGSLILLGIGSVYLAQTYGPHFSNELENNILGFISNE